MCLLFKRLRRSRCFTPLVGTCLTFAPRALAAATLMKFLKREHSLTSPPPPASPSSPIPHKQEPSEHSEIVQTVFSDRDVNISAGKKAAQQSVYSTPHRYFFV